MEKKYFCNNDNFEKFFSSKFILSEFYKFLDKDDIKHFCLLIKKIYTKSCELIKTLKINKEAETLNLESLFKKYHDINNLDLSKCKIIKDFRPISKLKELTNLNASNINISDISFLEKNKKLKELNLEFCPFIKDFSPISKLENLEILDVSITEITGISFLEKNKKLKELNLNFALILKIIHQYPN